MSGNDTLRFKDFLTPNKRPYTLGDGEDANLVGMRLYGAGPFHRELKAANNILKKSHFVIRSGDIIYNKLFAWKGTFGIVPHSLDGMFVSDKFPTYSIDETQVAPEFLQWYFQYPPLWEQARQMSTGSAALSKLTLNPPRFLDLTLPRFALREQVRIAKKIDQLSKKVSDVERLQAAISPEVTALPKSYLQQLCEDYPADGQLDRVLNEKPRNGWSAKCDGNPDGTAVLSLSAVTGYDYDASAYKWTSLPTIQDAHYWLAKGDLLITRSNSPELVGHAAIYNGSPSPCIFPDLMMRLPINQRLTTAEFVWCWLQTPLVRDFITANASGTSPTMKKISQKIVQRIPFPTSITLEEQVRVLSGFKSIATSCVEVKKAMRKSSEKTVALRFSILDRAFRGEL